MTQIKFDASALKKFVHENELGEMQAMVNAADEQLRKGTGAGADFTDWLHLPTEYDQDEFARIKAAAKKIQTDSDVLVVIGIGGSYLGTRMAIDFLHNSLYYSQDAKDRKQPLVLYAGNSLSSSYLHDLIEVIGDRDFSVNVVSKSGTTTEPAIAFRVFKELLIKKYGEAEANQRIYATTDAKRGALKTEADQAGWETFVIPDGVGGRFSVLTAVGLLPIAVSGADIDQLMAGAADAEKAYTNPDLKQNEAYQYAAYRNILYRKGFTTELLENYEPNMTMFAEWWKQLAGESEGKDQKGIYPSSANFTTDLHSLGQYIQEGMRTLMETVVKLDTPNHDVTIPEEEKDADGLGYLQGKNLDWVNTQAYKAVVAAHNAGGVPVMTVHIPKEDEYTLGSLIYFFEVAIAISGYLNGINPFNQPGVEAYKTNMFGLLGKPGFEEVGNQLRAQMEEN
ncbi:MAG: glucose-6-phosphate isomerase [Ligilactobacillus agilis]|nr:glucose-6-phosphate isomerase [Ligilactobacillus agilis]